jgi:hypothetical protein
MVLPGRGSTRAQWFGHKHLPLAGGAAGPDGKSWLLGGSWFMPDQAGTPSLLENLTRKSNKRIRLDHDFAKDLADQTFIEGFEGGIGGQFGQL